MKRVVVVILCAIVAFSAVVVEADCMAWVLCNPKTFVALRWSPSRKSSLTGRCFCGDQITLTSTNKNGYILTGEHTETYENWISGGYVSYAPVEVRTFKAKATVGKLRCYDKIGGKVLHRLKKGQIVTVYAWSEGWCITNKGYVRSEYLEEIEEQKGGE